MPDIFIDTLAGVVTNHQVCLWRDERHGYRFGSTDNGIDVTRHRSTKVLSFQLLGASGLPAAEESFAHPGPP